jgi:hypothetical protein
MNRALYSVLLCLPATLDTNPGHFPIQITSINQRVYKFYKDGDGYRSSYLS